MTGSKLAISVNSVSKRYRLGAKVEQFDSLGASILAMLKNPVKNYRKYHSLYDFSDVDDMAGVGLRGRRREHTLGA